MIELAVDTIPYATAGYLQYRMIRTAIAPDNYTDRRGGWLCVVLPWICR